MAPKSILDDSIVGKQVGAFSILRGFVELIQQRETGNNKYTVLVLNIGGGNNVRVTDWSNNVIANVEKLDKIEIACKLKVSKKNTNFYVNHEAVSMNILLRAKDQAELEAIIETLSPEEIRDGFTKIMKKKRKLDVED